MLRIELILSSCLCGSFSAYLLTFLLGTIVCTSLTSRRFSADNTTQYVVISRWSVQPTAALCAGLLWFTYWSQWRTRIQYCLDRTSSNPDMTLTWTWLKTRFIKSLIIIIYYCCYLIPTRYFCVLLLSYVRNPFCI